MHSRWSRALSITNNCCQLFSRQLLLLQQFSRQQLLLQQLRLKGTKRVRAPPVAKEKNVYIPKAVRLNKKTSVVLSGKELAEFNARIPLDDVWITKYYPVQSCTLREAITRHCELASPEMFDCLSNPLFLQLELDMTTKKKTRFVASVSGSVLLPHNFDDGVENRVVVITKEAEDQEIAREKGAEFVGGTDIIKKIESGTIKLEDFDYVILNLDLLMEASIIKKLLKDQFPSKKKGNLGEDISSMVQLFVNGRPFESEKQVNGASRLIMPVGQLTMTSEELYDNCKAVIEAVSATKPSTTGPQIVKKIAVACPPSPEIFIVHDPDLLASARRAASTSQSSEQVIVEEVLGDDKQAEKDDD